MLYLPPRGFPKSHYCFRICRSSRLRYRVYPLPSVAMPIIVPPLQTIAQKRRRLRLVQHSRMASRTGGCSRTPLLI